MSKIQYFLATGFYSGYSPIAPGTAGSVLMFIILWFLLPLQPLLHIGLAAGITAVGIWSAAKVDRDLGKDPSIVVIDEMAGMTVSLFLIPHKWIYFLIAFLLFRAFDVTKPFLIKKAEDLHGGVGIMLDDLIAGLYACVLLQFLIQIKII